MKPLRILLAAALLCAPALPCTAFLVVGNGQILFGNNEDYLNPETRLWFLPAEGERRGVMYVGFDNGFAQGGMNDAGLAFDGFATRSKPLVERGDNPAFPGNPITEAMETCTTVAEVEEFLRGVDLSPLLTQGMLLFADANGDSVIVEGDAFLHKRGRVQVSTNFYQSEHEDDRAQCPRYAAALGILEAGEETSLEVCTRALAASAQRGRRIATLYSNVFDLKARTAHLYLLHDFEHAVVLDLDEELAKGARTLRIPDLFPDNTAYAEYEAYYHMNVEQRIASRRGPDPGEDALSALEGDYALNLRGKDFDLALWHEDATLVARSEMFSTERNEIVLHSASPTEFFFVDEQSELDLTFHRDDRGEVTGFSMDLGAQIVEATRVQTD